MRYSVPVTFHVDAASRELAGERVEATLDMLFGMHWRDLQSPGAYINNASVIHKRITGPHEHVGERDAGSVAEG
jgi:hypothetical protein